MKNWQSYHFPISIPLWSDFNLDITDYNEHLFKLLIKKISIPLWSDFNITWAAGTDGTYYISIPLWSDFNKFYIKMIDIEPEYFNPIMV